MTVNAPRPARPGGGGRAAPNWSLDEFRRTEDSLTYVRAINPKGFHMIAYHVWGKPDDVRPLFCVHGLTRHGGDFDPLARALAGRRKIVCPDLVGRGASDWLPDPDDYHVPQYNCDLTAVLAAAGCSEVDWIGTSLGGLCGIVMAGLPNSPIRRLVINDVAPEVPMPALRRVAGYLAGPIRLADYAATEAHLREIYAGFGPMTDDDWRHMAHTSVYREDDGSYAPHFDPGIGENFRQYWLLVRFNFWTYWKRIKCPILILRGTNSDFLTPELLARMVAEQPGASVIEFDGVGHTPTLNTAAQIDPILSWLDATEEEPGRERQDNGS
ncbi:alpha/beta fold hydrolase [Roseisalinus antarcticus]|uniref:Acyl-CoA esterase n=1 Tax=Roseisalinus antarcticus TaxID=254357 RepID=A0A1Y5SZJ9_9RHOB|nr:alpha/beta hydrolase [Roseisalinus antarcticus]SLN52557.1 acyl-CoA esterase [Roseisalinus antarcticus]